MIIVLETNSLLQCTNQSVNIKVMSIVHDTGFSYLDEWSQTYHWWREILGYIKPQDGSNDQSK